MELNLIIVGWIVSILFVEVSAFFYWYKLTKRKDKNMIKNVIWAYGIHLVSLIFIIFSCILYLIKPSIFSNNLANVLLVFSISMAYTSSMIVFILKYAIAKTERIQKDKATTESVKK